MKTKKIVFGLIMIAMSMCMIVSWNNRDINTLAIVTAIGIDKSPNGYLVTLQVVHPDAISLKHINEAPVILFTEEGKDVYEVLQRLTTQSSRTLYLSHAKIIVFGQKFAEEGISYVLEYMLRSQDLRTDFYFLVAKDTMAKDVLTVLTPLEAIPATKIYNALKNSEEVWAPTKTVRIVELINAVVSEGKEPVLSGIEITGSEIKTVSTDTLNNTKLDNILKLSSIGVLKKDKFLGWLDEEESKGYNYITNNIKNTGSYVDVDSGTVSFSVKKVQSKQKAYLINEEPAIKVIIDVEADIEAVSCEMDITKEENIKELEKLSEEKIVSICNEVFVKAQKDFNSDIFGFGDEIHRTYPKLWEKLEDKWDIVFGSLDITIEVNMQIKGAGSFSKPFFIQ